MSTFVYMESYTRRVYLLGYHGAPLSCLSCMHMTLLSDDCKDTVHSLPAILIKINTSLNLSMRGKVNCAIMHLMSRKIKISKSTNLDSSIRCLKRFITDETKSTGVPCVWIPHYLVKGNSDHKESIQFEK